MLRAVAFYQNASGLGSSDTSRDIVAFLHGRHGSDHHLVAFAKGAAKAGTTQLVGRARHRGRGPRRGADGGARLHPRLGHRPARARIELLSLRAGSVGDRSPSTARTSTTSPPGSDWQAGDWPPEDSLYLLGPGRAADISANSEEEYPERRHCLDKSQPRRIIHRTGPHAGFRPGTRGNNSPDRTQAAEAPVF